MIPPTPLRLLASALSLVLSACIAPPGGDVSASNDVGRPASHGDAGIGDGRPGQWDSAPSAGDAVDQEAGVDTVVGGGAASDAPAVVDSSLDPASDGGEGDAPADVGSLPVDVDDTDTGGAAMDGGDVGPGGSDTVDGGAGAMDSAGGGAADSSGADASAGDAAGADSAGSGLLGPPPAQLSHPLATAADVVELLNLHQLAATTSLHIASRLFKLGDATCPGAATVTQDWISADLAKPCTITTSAASLTLAGRLAFAQPNICKGSKQTLSTILAEGFTLSGTVAGKAVSIALELSYQATPQLTTWTGHARYTSVPSSWIPSTHGILEGTEVWGWAVAAAGDAASGRSLSGVLLRAGAGSAKVVTDKPLLSGAMAQGCFKPTSGQLRVVGAVDVMITFKGQGTCADPTWTRAGKPMGSLKIPFWSSLTLCGGVGSP